MFYLTIRIFNKRKKILKDTKNNKILRYWLEKMNVLAYKISSTEMNNYPLVDYIASKMKPIILSTGMNDMKSVKKAVKTIKKYHDDFAIQHCTNIYPTPPEKVRLNLLKELSEAFPNEIIGLSDHSLNNYACYAAL